MRSNMLIPSAPRHPALTRSLGAVFPFGRFYRLSMSNENIVTILILVTEATFVSLGHRMFREETSFVADGSMQ
jgi:hypothetical protein